MHAQGKGVNAESVLSTRAQQGMRVAKARIAPRLSYESRQSESLAHDFPFPFPFPLSICPYFPHFLSSVVCFLAPRHGKSDSYANLEPDPIRLADWTNAQRSSVESRSLHQGISLTR